MIGRILPIVLILLSIAIFFAYVSPTYSKKIVPIQAQIKQYDNTLAAAEDFNRKEAQLATERNAIPNDSIVRLLAFLPDGVDNIQLILDLNALAGRTGVHLSGFEVTPRTSQADSAANGALIPVENASSVESADLTVKATGSYEDFRAFLDGVEHSLRPLDLVQLSLSQSETGTYTYEMTFRIYWLR